MSTEVKVSALYVRCSFPRHALARAASDMCQAPADSAVIDENGNRMYRCPAHRGLLRGGGHGDVVETVPRPTSHPNSTAAFYARSRHVCGDDCRRGSATAVLNGPYVCGSCGGWREDINEPERQRIRAWNERHEWEEAWRRHYNLPSILLPMERELPEGAILP